MPVKGLTPEEIAARTFEQVQGSVKSTSAAAKLPGESQSEANARLTAAYKELQAKPILSPEQVAGGAKVQYTRQAAGGIGEYVVTVPPGYSGPTITKEFGAGIIRPDLVRTNVTTAGVGPGTVVPAGVTTTTAAGSFGTAKTPDQIAAYNNAKALAQTFVDTYGGKLSNYFDAVTGKVTSPSKEVISAALNTKGTGGQVTEVSRFQNGDGSVTVTYSDGTKRTFSPGVTPSTSSTSTTSTSTEASDALAAAGRSERQSAYDLLYQQFNQYGLGALVEPLRGLIISGASPAEFTIKLRESDAYKKRFAANASRIANGLAAISEAEYLGLEDQYQNIMRNYGLPQEYYARGDMGTQEGFNKFIANDVSAAELEDRIMTAQNRVLKANPEVLASLKQFYPDINNGDILAYTLDPAKGLDTIKRKVTAAEIGGAATQAGLGITGTRAEELGAAGITKQQAQQGFQTVAEVAPRGGQLAAIYGESPYTQQTAEQEIFGLAGSTEAAKQRKKLAGLERAAFSGQSGAAQGALNRERAGAV